MSELVSTGKCPFCNQEFNKATITKHLSKHITEKLSTSKPGKSFLLKIEANPTWGDLPYFLQIWIDGNTTMDEVDYFLRQIWLECCGHMSAFTNPAKQKKGAAIWDFFEVEDLLTKGKTKEYEKIMEDSNGEIPLSKKAKDVLMKSLKLVYDYDFGSTTSLQLTVFAEYAVKADSAIVLLSRNEPPEILCNDCGVKPAVKVCSVCLYNQQAYFCKDCAKKHGKTCNDFKEYASMPVVNSPRMGVCAYDGGRIDKKRDGVFVKK